MDAIGQALGGIVEASAAPGEGMRTGIGQKVETSFVDSIFRLVGWAMTTTMSRDKDLITGVRINGTGEFPGIATRRRQAVGFQTRPPRLETGDASARVLGDDGAERRQ